MGEIYSNEETATAKLPLKQTAYKAGKKTNSHIQKHVSHQAFGKTFRLRFSPDPPAATISVPPAAGTQGPPTIETNPALVAWKKKDRFVLLWIKTTLSENAIEPRLWTDSACDCGVAPPV
ncbi:hypothetical protein LXL04_016749 [Taraxacum kok-saghyz]